MARRKRICWENLCILTLEAKDEEESYEIGYSHLKKQGYDIEAVSSFEKYRFDVDVIKAAL